MKKLTKFFARNILKNNPFFFLRLNRIKKLYELSQDKLLELQNQAFIKLLNRTYTKSTFYHKIYDQHGINILNIKDLSDLKKLPVITKSDVKKHIEEILIGTKYLTKSAYTSGTSGSPLKVYRNYASIVEEEAHLWRHRELFGHKMGMKTVTMRGDLNRNTFKFLDPFSNTLYLSSYLLSDKSVDKYYEEICSFAPHAIYAFPSSVELLANYLIEKGKSLHVPLIFTSSETLYAFQRAKIQKVFNARIADWYGNAERTIALEENLEGTYDELKLYSINEYQKDHTITTSLINNSFPLIRYIVDDVLIPDNSGNVERIIGRVDDAIELPDGTKVVRLGLAFNDVDGISFAQIIQNHFNEILINIVPSNLFNEETKAQVVNKVRPLVGSEIVINIAIVTESEIVKTDRGKYKLVINNLNSSDRKVSVLA